MREYGNSTHMIKLRRNWKAELLNNGNLFLSFSTVPTILLGIENSSCSKSTSKISLNESLQIISIDLIGIKLSHRCLSNYLLIQLRQAGTVLLQQGGSISHRLNAVWMRDWLMDFYTDESVFRAECQANVPLISTAVATMRKRHGGLLCLEP